MKLNLPICLLCLIGIYTALTLNLSAQPLDRILAVIDDEVVLYSEVENQYEYYLKNGQKDDGTLRCMIFESLLTSKLLLSKARIDSLVVNEDQIEGELNRRIEAIIRQVGSIEEVQKIYGKSILEMKMDLRPDIAEQLLIDEQKKKVFNGVEVTPREIKTFFQGVPKDSLPYFPAEVELSHIVIKPKPSAVSKKEAKEKLKKVRAEILEGKATFEFMAKVYSQDPGSSKNGGSLGEFGRGEMVPEFEEVLYNLTPGAISEVFESPFGFHIIQLHKRMGDRVQASHILVRGAITKEDEQKAVQRLKEIHALIKSDSLSFERAANDYSEDKRTASNGGMITTPAGDVRVPLDQLDADLYLKMDQMKVGEISEPLEFISQEGELAKAYHIIWLKKRIPPHRANLKDDYQKFQQAALQARQAEELQKWFQKTKKQVFIEIKDNECSQALQNWN